MSSMVGAGTAALVGCAMKPKSGGFIARGEIRALLLHLGHNMWNDYLPAHL